MISFQDCFFQFLFADALDGIAEPFTGLRIVFEKGQRGVADAEQCLFVFYKRDDRLSLADPVAKQTAEAQQITRNRLIGVCRAGKRAAAAVITSVMIN